MAEFIIILLIIIVIPLLISRRSIADEEMKDARKDREQIARLERERRERE